MRTASLLALLVAAAAPAAGDTVYLVNGRTYEGVIAERRPDGVHIQLAFGSITLPHAQVARIVEEEPPLAEYLARREALREGEGSAGEWLALARFARTHQIAQGIREAALAAAALEPRLAGLAPLLEPFGFAFDQEGAVWVSREELMRRRGFVADGAAWITVEEARQRDGERLARLTELLETERRSREIQREAELEARRQVERHEDARHDAGTPVVVGVPIAVHWPGWWHHPRPPPHPAPSPPEPAPEAPRSTAPATWDDLSRRQPGSLIPAGTRRMAGTSTRSGGS